MHVPQSQLRPMLLHVFTGKFNYSFLDQIAEELKYLVHALFCLYIVFFAQLVP
jgi:hypothetical protein